MMQMIKKPPLFALEVVIAEGSLFEYNTVIRRFEEVTTKAIDHCLTVLQTIPQVEAFVMDKLKWSKIPNIGAVQLNEPLVGKLKSRVQVLLYPDLLLDVKTCRSSPRFSPPCNCTYNCRGSISEKQQSPFSTLERTMSKQTECSSCMVTWVLYRIPELRDGKHTLLYFHIDMLLYEVWCMVSGVGSHKEGNDFSHAVPRTVFSF